MMRSLMYSMTTGLLLQLEGEAYRESSFADAAQPQHCYETTAIAIDPVF